MGDQVTDSNVSKGPDYGGTAADRKRDTVSPIRHDSGMTNTPEYPFWFVGILLAENRKQALESIDYHAERVSDACSHLMSRATKDEFLAWASTLWDEASDEFNDYMSKPQL